MTDKFDEGGSYPAPTTTPTSNKLPPGVAIKDSTGRLNSSVTIDSNNRGTYSRTMGENDLGVRTMNASFSGKPGVANNFTQHVYDDNGILQGSRAGTVDQVVAGPGVYISSPNGQGVVTVSLTPLPTQVVDSTLFDVVWTTETSAKPFGVVGHFTAVGNNGVNLRSRDGVNWAQMSGINSTILGCSSEINADIPDQHIEMNGVGPGGSSIYGRVGTNGDAMITRSQLSDQSGLITERLISTFIFSATTSTGGGGGGSTGTTTSTVFTTQTFAFRNNTSYVAATELLWTGGYGGISEPLSVVVTPTSAWADTYDWSITVGGVEIGYGVTSNGTTNTFSSEAGDIPAPAGPGILYGYSTGNQFTFTQGTYYPVTVTVSNVSTGATIAQTITQVRWS